MKIKEKVKQQQYACFFFLFITQEHPRDLMKIYKIYSTSNFHWNWAVSDKNVKMWKSNDDNCHLMVKANKIYGQMRKTGSHFIYVLAWHLRKLHTKFRP